LTQGTGLRGGVSGTITNITQANPAQVTSTNHGLNNGEIVAISNVVGMTQVNGNTYIITVVDANNFTLDVDSTAFGAYVSGGIWAAGYFGILNNTPIVRSVNNNPMVQTATSPTSAYLPTPSTIATPLFPNQAIPSRVQNILITANSSLGSTQNVTDDGAGNLIGDAIGTINYQSGQVSVLFNNPVPSGENIQVMYTPTVMARPLSILIFQNQFTLRPVPDQGYTIELIAYRQPSQALLGSTDPDNPNTAGVPELKEWWELLAMGAAKKFFEDQQDTVSLQVMEKYLFDRYAVVEARTYAQIGSKQRIGTIYADQMNNGYGGWGGSGYGGFGI
jgi:hypothetical protein